MLTGRDHEVGYEHGHPRLHSIEILTPA